MATANIARPARALRLPALVDFAAGAHGRAVATLVAVALIAFLPGFFQIPPVDRDEARFAQATKQMIERGDFVDIRFQEESRYKKPIAIYWLQAGVVTLAEAAGLPRARTTIALYRIPSLLGAVGAVLLTYWAALGFVSRRAAVLAGVMMAASILLGVEARLAKTDAMLLLACVAAMGALGRVYLAEHDRRTGESPWLVAAIFWLALAGGVLLKGPIILMFAGLAAATLAVLDRSARWLWRVKPVHGVVLLLLVVLPWFLAIGSRSGADFFADALGRDLLAKVGRGQESHGAPPGYYFALFWATFFPGSILAGLAAPAVWRARREPGAKFLLAWFVPAWLVFEIIATKLPHYVLPLYPAIAILIAGVVDHHDLSRRPWLVRGTVWWFLIVAIMAALTVAAHAVLGQRLGVLAWPFAAGAVIFALGAWWLFEVDGAEHALLRAAAAAVLISVAVFAATVPRLPSLFPSAAIARYLRGAGCASVSAAAGYHEPSLVFLAGTATVLTDGPGAADFLYSGGCRFAAVERSQERAFVQRAEALGLRYARGLRIEGVNIGVGRKVSIVVFRAERAP